jgi:beta-galactosidase/beta-glucuronidase
MNSYLRHITLGFVFIGIVGCSPVDTVTESKTQKVNVESYQDVSESNEHDFNFNWRFEQSNPSNAHAEGFDDSQWQEVRLPHDWSILSEYSRDNPGASAYLPGGYGWYRKSFIAPADDKKVQLLFDGIYNQSSVYINGKLLGTRPYGYVPILYDLTPHLHKNGTKNTIAVFVDRSRDTDSRWYPGAGIYRNVSLLISDKLHIPRWSTYVTTPRVSNKEASIKIATTIMNEHSKDVDAMLSTQLFSPDGTLVSDAEHAISLAASIASEHAETITVKQPALWDVDSPNLYKLVLNVRSGTKTLSSETHNIGLRYFKNDPDTGFHLNGKPLKIKGVNIHHDGGLVGAAVPEDVWKRRLLKLKEAGVNTIRTAHNPASKEFIALCDKLGFLVQSEAFDEWDNPKDKRKNFNLIGDSDYVTQSYNLHFAEWAERDIKAMVLRDRNSPSIFQWSIGNEIEWTYSRYTQATGYWEKNEEIVSYYFDPPPRSLDTMKKIFNESEIKGPELAKSAAKLSAWIKELDTTRPVTANLVVPSVSHFAGYGDALDVIGYSYRQSVYDWGRERFADKMIYGSENWVKWHEWKAVAERDDIAGIMLWTGIDYLGESKDRWPRKGSNSGMLDFAGFKKPAYHMMKTLWHDEPHVFMTTYPLNDSKYKLENGKVLEKVPGSWQKEKWGWRPMNPHWNYQANESIVVEVYTNQAQVELFLNDESLGIQTLTENDDRILKWAVPFTPGTLSARSLNSNNAQTTMITATQPASITLQSDEQTITDNGYDVLHIVAQLVDKSGAPIKHIERELSFTVPQGMRLLGVDNGSHTNVQPHATNTITTYHGRALLLVQTLRGHSGSFDIVGKSEGMPNVTLSVNVDSTIKN